MALGLLPMESRDVKTPTGSYFSGLVQQGELCAVSVMRAGDAIVNNLRKIVRRAHYGQILIQSDSGLTPSLFAYIHSSHSMWQCQKKQKLRKLVFFCF